MKATTTLMLALALMLALPTLSSAQAVAEAPAAESRLDQFFSNPLDEVRDVAWWKELEAELIPTGENAAQNIQVATLQNIIFFAQNYGDMINLERSADLLADIYAGHSNDGVRIMALVGLHSTDSEQQLLQIAKNLRHEDSQRVRAHTAQMLSSYFDGRYKEDHPAFMYITLNQ